MSQTIHTSPTRIVCYLCRADFKNLGLLHHHQVTAHTSEDLSLALLSVQCHDFSKLDSDDDGDEAVFLRNGLSKYPHYVKSDQKQTDNITIIEPQGENTEPKMFGKKMPGEVNVSATRASNDLDTGHSEDGCNSDSSRKGRANYHSTTLGPTLYMTCSSDEEKDNTNKTSQTFGLEQHDIDTVNKVLNLGTVDITVDVNHVEGLERDNNCTESSDNSKDTNCESNKVGHLETQIEMGRSTVDIGCSANVEMYNIGSQTDAIKKRNGFSSPVRRLAEVRIKRTGGYKEVDCPSLAPEPTRRILRSHKHNVAVYTTIHHTTERNFKCTKCEKMYTKKSHLDRHCLSHTKECPNVCPHCNKRFTKHSAFKRHIRVHANEKTYSCSTCLKQFPQKENLLTHIMQHKTKRFKCFRCGKAFVSNHRLISHCKYYCHGTSQTCKICSMHFYTTGALKEHYNVHKKPMNTNC